MDRGSEILRKMTTVEGEFPIPVFCHFTPEELSRAMGIFGRWKCCLQKVNHLSDALAQLEETEQHCFKRQVARACISLQPPSIIAIIMCGLSREEPRYLQMLEGEIQVRLVFKRMIAAWLPLDGASSRSAVIAPPWTSPLARQVWYLFLRTAMHAKQERNLKHRCRMTTSSIKSVVRRNCCMRNMFAPACGSITCIDLHDTVWLAARWEGTWKRFAS
jgi:hypothetical protein